jgi:hypothetical protein
MSLRVTGNVPTASSVLTATKVRVGNEAEKNASVVLPQSNGVNITIINPTTNVNSGESTLTANAPDMFTPLQTPPVQPQAPLVV